MAEKCIVCGHKILMDSRNYQKRLEAFRSAVGYDDIAVCDNCIRKGRSFIGMRMIKERLHEAARIKDNIRCPIW